MDDVARRAEVGVGTVYRHFPTKEALIEALAVDSFERVVAKAREALELDDPWEALTSTLWAGAEIMAGDRALTELMALIPGPMLQGLPIEQELNATMTELLRRAQEAGELRPRRGPRRHPDGHVRDRLRDAQGAPLPRRVAPPPDDRDRRPARRATPRDRCLPSLWGMSAPEAVTDPELQQVEWDLSHLLDGAGDDPQAAVDTLLAEAQRRADAFAERYAGKLDELDGPGLVAGDARAGRDRGDRRPRRHLRAPVVLDRHRRSRARRAAAAGRGEGHGDRDRAAVLPPRVGGARRRARRGAAGRRRARLRAPSPAHGAPLPPAPAVRARGADPHREGAVRPLGVGAAVRGADGGDHGRARRRRRAGVAGDRAGAPVRSRPRGAPRRRRARDRGAAARPAHARLHVQHAARGQDDRRPAARLSALAGGAQPVQRGLRRVGAGADRGGPRALRAAAPLVPAEGAAARDRPARRLRPDGRRHAGQREGAVAGGQADRARRLRVVLRRPRDAGRAVLRRVVDRRAGAAGQARRRVLLLRRRRACTRT